jgi:rhamnosyltransferase
LRIAVERSQPGSPFDSGLVTYGVALRAQDILAVVVSFNGRDKTLATIDALSGRVGHIHVVDNGSQADSIHMLRRLEQAGRISLASLPRNKGVGFALNVGIAAASESGYRWLLTMDQDSVIDPCMIDAYVRAVWENPEIACMTPVLIVNGVRQSAESGVTDVAITSGNIVRMDIFQRIGLYNEEMFIDAIDFDFSLRVRRAGYAIHRVGDALLSHELGDQVPARYGLERVHTFHSPERRYYMYRNCLVMIEKYVWTFPGFILKMVASHIVYLFSIVVLGKERFRSLIFIMRGVRDYFAGRLGQYQDLENLAKPR